MLLLFDHGADIQAQDTRGRTALHSAAQCGWYQMALILLDHGADIQAEDATGSPPLHMAAQCGWDRVMSLMLDRGADVRATYKDGQTARQFAKFNRHELAPLVHLRGGVRSANVRYPSPLLQSSLLRLSLVRRSDGGKGISDVERARRSDRSLGLVVVWGVGGSLEL
ncbi:ankyrin repeat-containing domain protein [Tricharina praecox]|uniref:ankyrin repeat-containing domain protein n=1 Tax=Tricharina praecox TaxID=43433 RepID=UPI00221F53D4|nr:ankyrin repeat-containing domain protein [Tricharina praecox]KAI5845938.1 ankyrin repeat-containing domain protein [Tricharina praecox]